MFIMKALTTTTTTTTNRQKFHSTCGVVWPYSRPGIPNLTYGSLSASGRDPPAEFVLSFFFFAQTTMSEGATYTVLCFCNAQLAAGPVLAYVPRGLYAMMMMMMMMMEVVMMMWKVEGGGQ